MTETPSRLLLLLVAIAGVVLPGIGNYGFGQAGYATLGTVVWAGGYGLTAIAIWYYWIRPMDISGPSGNP